LENVHPNVADDEDSFPAVSQPSSKKQRVLKDDPPSSLASKSIFDEVEDSSNESMDPLAFHLDPKNTSNICKFDDQPVLSHCFIDEIHEESVNTEDDEELYFGQQLAFFDEEDDDFEGTNE
jgi:hypothetical protein